MSFKNPDLKKAPAAKLPLAAKKDVRDEWENKRAGLEAQMLELSGVAWTFEANAAEIFPYAEEGSYGNNSPGACIFAYFDAFLWSFKYLLESHKELMKDEINSVCPKHIVTLVPSDQFSYSGTEVLDGKLCLVFHPNCLGSNINDVAQKLADTLSTAPQPEGASILSYNARHSIKTEYDGEITPLLEKARTALQNPEFQFEPGFEAIGEMLKNSKEVRDDWQTNLGSFAKSYFESFVDKLADEKFGEDELLREGLEESVTKGVLKLRVVEKLASGYNEILVEDGALVIQTTPSNWGTNIHYAAEKLVSLL